MSENNLLVSKIADQLSQAQLNRVPIAPVAPLFDQYDLTSAYSIQELNTVRQLQEGARLVGRKIGLTSKAVQTQLGVDQPDYGMLFAHMAVGDAEEISLRRLIQPKVEAEIAIVLGRDLNLECATYADLIGAIEYCLPAIEVVDSRIENWKIGIFDTIADNASSGLFVLGSTPKRLSDFDIASCTMRMTSNDTVVSQGSGKACLGNPLNAAIWLSNQMYKNGRPLLAGDVVLTGALGPMVAVTSSQAFRAEIEGLGVVTSSFVL